MKKVLFLIAASLLTAGLSAQTIVSTQVEKRNVLLEEFTGVRCGYCPDGHARANAICEQYEGHAWAINIHAGGYATNSGYETPAGNAVHNEFLSQIEGYPCGTVNRGSIQDRGQWASTAATIRNQDAVVNIAAQGSVDNATRTVTMHIEAYYTGNSSADTNYFNVAVTQDNILGTQSNYGPYNTDYIENGQYRHMHMLRDLLVGNWGVAIPATQGSFFDTTIVYTVPDAINGLAVNELADLNFIAFITQNHKTVLNAQKVIIPESTPRLTKVLAEQASDCSLQYNFTAIVTNNTVDDYSTVVLNVDGTDQTYNVNIPSFTSAEITLPSYTFEVSGAAVQNCASVKSVSLVSATNADGETVDINGPVKTAGYADFSIYTVESPLTLRFGIDAYGSEAGVQLVNQSNCTVLWSEGPWSDLNVNWNNIHYISEIPGARMKEVTFSPASAGLYILRATDEYGDGWTSTNNTEVSGMWLSNASGAIFADEWGYSNGPSFSQYDYYLNITNAGDGSHNLVGIENAEPVVEFNVYPNPAADRLSISGIDGLREVSILDVTGRTVMTLGTTNTVDVSGLAAGVYIVRVATEQGIGMQKFVKE